MDYVIKDKRFDHVQKDPRFKKMPVGQRKVKIDKRFKGMFKDKRFKLKYSVDKRGKPMNHTTNENLKKFYELSDQDDSDSDTEAMSRQVVNDSENSDNESAMTAVKEKQNEKKTKKKKPPQTTDKRFQVSHIDNDSDESDEEIEIPESGNKKNLNTSSAKKNKNKSEVKPKGKKNKKEVEVEPENSDEESGNEDEDGLSASDDDDDSDSDDEETAGQKSGIDLARGEGNVVSSSSEEDDDDDADTDSNDDDDDDQQDDSKFDHGWGENDITIISLDEATYRLAVCNMDWDRMKAKDIFVLLNSFKPSNGLIKSVKVYPSEYGKERMAEETAHGPRELKEMTIDEDGVSETVEGTSYHREKLREYQLNRLKYYYAVVECDSVQTADVIYNECDGLEYESSATKLDLRFIPDEETFNEDEVKTVCTNIPSNYKPQYFLNAALTQTKVELTWDETDHERVNLTTQHLKGEDIEEEDLKAYLASSSDEEGGAPDYGALLEGDDDNDDDDGSGDEDKKINKYKQLLTDIASDEKKKKGDVEMEISWEPGLREATEKIVKKKKEGKNKTVWEDYLERKKEKKRQKIEERKKKKEKKHADSGSESDSENDQETGDRPVQTFSDDDVDEDMAAFMAEESDQPHKQKKNKNKKKKKKKGETEETEESSKEKAELALLMMDEENKKHFSLRDLVTEDGKKKKKKNKKELMKKNMAAKGDEEDFKINVEDPRFSAVFDSHLYNIDPSAPEYRKTKGTEAIVSEKIKRISKKDKQKRSHPEGGDQNVKKQKLTDTQPKKDESLASLIKSVKSKTAHFHGNKSKSKR